jgi:hypothetical protein
MVLGLVAVLAGEEATAGGFVAAAGPAIGFAEARTTPSPPVGRGVARQTATVPSRTNQSVSNLYWRDLENARATAVRHAAALWPWRFDAALRSYLAGLLRAPTG